MNRGKHDRHVPLPFRPNLPTALTSFVGRKREIVDLSQLLASGHLISLVGAGGCGKTRIALRVAAEFGRQRGDDVCWVELARLADPTLVPLAVAKVLHVAERSGQPLIDTLLDSL